MTAILDRVRKVADAVLYEGFLLYPYTLQTLKNRMRWQFGVLMPDGYADSSESHAVETSLLVQPHGSDGHIDVLVRFLEACDPVTEREVRLTCALGTGKTSVTFERGALRGEIDTDVCADGPFLRVTVRIANHTCIAPTSDRNEALCGAFVGVHAIFLARGASFVSLLDPVEGAAEAAARCCNTGIFPVLAGEREGGGQTSAAALASPIILYDFPELANESAGPTFDATEIDELLMLSVTALSDEEKRRARETDPRVAQIFDRAESLGAKAQRVLHGRLTVGTHVRVHPKRRADAFDLFAEGRTARVRGVHEDVDGRRYVTVLFDDDPATEMHEWYGRSFFYDTDEIETLEP